MPLSISYDTIDENCYPSININALLLVTRVNVKHDHLWKKKSSVLRQFQNKELWLFIPFEFLSLTMFFLSCHSFRICITSALQI